MVGFTSRVITEGQAEKKKGAVAGAVTGKRNTPQTSRVLGDWPKKGESNSFSLLAAQRLDVQCKTHTKDGHWITIAKQPSGAFCVYDALLLGKRTFTSGFVMPDIDLRGQIHRERPMPYATYVRHLRWALVTICKYSEQEAASFTAHSARSGGATGMVHAGLDPVLGCAVAGVKSIDWFIGYMRANLSDKIRASLAIGPF